MEDNKNTTQEVEREKIDFSIIGKFNEMPTSKKLAVVGFVIFMICVMIFIIFFTGDSSSPSKPKERLNDVNIIEAPSIQIGRSTQNVYKQEQEKQKTTIDNVSTKTSELKPPSPPSLEKIEQPKPPEPPQSLPLQAQQVTQPQLPLPVVTSQSKKNDSNGEKVKQATNIIAFGGSEGEDKKKTGDESKTKDDKETFLGFDGGMIDNVSLKPTQAQSVVATKINNDLKYMIVQGKVIDAVLETAINTQMSSGVIRAVISRDVYGEQGDLVLIPKGSRLVGKYSASSSQNSSGSTGMDKVITRVYAIWNRIITPSGIDLNLPDTPATDTLGRNGIPGYLDTNLSNNLMNAFLVSILGPYIVAEISGQSKNNVNPGNNNNNNNNNNGLPVSLGTQVISQGVQDFQKLAKDQINTIYPPGVITNFIDQGTRIDIIFQQDILFPKQAIQLNTINLP